MNAQKPDALRLADALAYWDSSVASQAARELRRLHAENEALQQGYDAARLEIDHLRGATKMMEPAGEYPPLPDPKFTRVVDGIPCITLLEHRLLMRAYVDADRAMRARAASATDSYVQPVPDKCDRIVWRGNYYHLPLTPPAQEADSVTAPASGATGKNLLQVQAWVIPDGNGGGQFSWQKQDERYWTRLTPPAQEADSVTAPASGEVAGWLPVHSNGHKFYGAPLKTEAEAKQYINQVHQSSDSVTLIARPFTWIATPPTQAANSVLEDAARYRFLRVHCRSTSEHWGGRWSIIVDGPAPKSHDSEDDFDEAVDAARKQGANHD